MKLQTQIVSLGLAGALAASLVGGIGLFSTSYLGGVIDSAVQGSEALQASQEADMMHDAVRGDGQLALLGALEKNEARIAEAEKGLKEHAETFNKALVKLQAAPLSEESKAALAAAVPGVTAYLATADAMVKAARGDMEGAQKASLALQVTFADLETKMGALSDSIEKNGATLSAAALAGVAQTRLAVGGSLGLSVLGLLGLALLLARRMTVPMAHAVSAADCLAEGDLTRTIIPEGNEETRQLMEALARMQANVGQIVRGVQSNADRVASASVQIAQGNHDLSHRTEIQAGSLQQTAATMEELGTTVRHNADNARQASQLALGASGVAVQGGTVMAQVVQTMSGINDSSRKIADIIGVIDGIAFQTNILALNAAVEAARAGEQGRGFAVVASEVRSLAQRSAEAAREVKALVNTSVERVEQGTVLVDQAGQTMDEIVASIKRVTDIVGEISAASAEQSTGVGLVGAAVSQMDHATQQNAALVEQSAAAAEGLQQQAQELVRAVAVFRVDQTAAA